jgi:hypothetical protein
LAHDQVATPMDGYRIDEHGRWGGS